MAAFVQSLRIPVPVAAATALRLRSRWFTGDTTRTERLWFALAFPGLVLGVLAAFRVELDGAWSTVVGVAGGTLALCMWVARGPDDRACATPGCEPMGAGRRVVLDTNFVTAWVVFAFVGYELLVTVYSAVPAVVVGYGAYSLGW